MIREAWAKPEGIFWQEHTLLTTCELVLSLKVGSACWSLERFVNMNKVVIGVVAIVAGVMMAYYSKELIAYGTRLLVA